MGSTKPGEDDGRFYNPYAQYHGTAFDQKSVNKLYRLPSSPEFLFPEEAAVQRRNWSENLTYYTGCGYLSGAISGGTLGLVDGLRAAEEGDTLKLRINRVLNGSGHRGRSYGLGTGALFRVAAGPRAAAFAGAIGGIAAATAVTGKHVMKRYLPI
ncbi:hypothetical protein GOP47_0026835 [Adiantum capillus-veneris]|nr:hypothetical protein GOP47_0026835 [Adiantum capillus-veneris]